MIDFIFVAMVLFYCLLVFSVWVREVWLGAIAGMGIMITGIVLIINGITEVSAFLTNSVGIINIGLGGLVLIKGYVEKIQEEL